MRNFALLLGRFLQNDTVARLDRMIFFNSENCCILTTQIKKTII
jgi:hypothetical protein